VRRIRLRAGQRPPAVNRSESVSAPFVFASASGQKGDRRPPALIEDRLPLPGRFLLAALGKLGIACEVPGNGHAARGQVPFGWSLHDARLVRNGAEQQVIRLIRALQESVESLKAIARELNRRLVPAENAGLCAPGALLPLGAVPEILGPPGSPGKRVAV
jgi:hypothetical protein